MKSPKLFLIPLAATLSVLILMPDAPAAAQVGCWECVECSPSQTKADRDPGQQDEGILTGYEGCVVGSCDQWPSQCGGDDADALALLDGDVINDISRRLQTEARLGIEVAHILAPVAQYVEVNTSRQSIQILSCSGRVIANVPVAPSVLAQTEVFVELAQVARTLTGSVGF